MLLDDSFVVDPMLQEFILYLYVFFILAARQYLLTGHFLIISTKIVYFMDFPAKRYNSAPMIPDAEFRLPAAAASSAMPADEAGRQ
ncbi:MAG: hypothetical protein EXR27_15715 [Betaproteobacteria bacterium]|nr:hypothetical protein [Betaproteobacteria bacterium]